MKNQTFHKVGDECVLETRQGNVSTMLSRNMQDESFMTICCRLFDKTNVITEPTSYWYSTFHENLWSAYKQGIGSDTTIQLDSGKEFKVTIFRNLFL